MVSTIHYSTLPGDFVSTALKERMDATLVSSQCWWYCLGIGVVLVHVDVSMVLF